MKLKILTPKAEEKGTIELPKQFDEKIREDIVKRAVLSLQSKERQPYGAKPGAGMRHSAELSKRRRKYRGSYGFGISRVPRKILSRNGTRFGWVAALVPFAVGGRRAHPPKAEKKWEQKINKKENKKAIRSGMAATLLKEIVEKRGHKIPQNYPFILSSEFEDISKTADVKKALSSLGFNEEIKRTEKKKIRAGKGKLRGRRYKKKIGPLFVVSKECNLLKSAKNIQGVEVIKVNELNAKKLAPGTHIGRLTLWTEDAIKQIKEKKMFM